MYCSTVQQVEHFKFFEIVLPSDGRGNTEIDTQIRKVNGVLRELYRSVVTKREFSNTAKLSVLKSVFVPILIYGHWSGILVNECSCRTGRYRIFAKSLQSDTSREPAHCTAMKFIKFRMSSHYSDCRDLSCVGSAM